MGFFGFQGWEVGTERKKHEHPHTVFLHGATRGSHRQYKHPSKSGRITLAGHPADDLAPGTLNSALKQAGLKGRNE
ncbi:type II toxin-antitoxin system HicA family toxin [Methanoculleus oceani]|uniref:type II toxin-antitoxin system HicA family toxin n=1 Tax=Methanoculleus oceani TaxID=2184756 RepID=UPI00331B6333